MERIQNVLQRLQELYYSKHAKSAIDIDLMLDYSRVLYADLLEWKKNVPTSIPGNEAPTEAAPEVIVEKEAPAADDSVGPNIEETITPEEVITPEAAEPQPEEATEEEDTENETTAAPEAVVEEEAADEGEPENSKVAGPEQNIYSEVTDENPEQEILEEVHHRNSGISFEPPHTPPVLKLDEDDIVAEAPTVNEPVLVADIPEIKAEQDNGKQDLFSFISSSRKDIRVGIGINDKYLFLNELFNNHKTDYEEALDRLNRFNGYEEAYNWLVANSAVHNKWEENDETVQNFFAVLKKHFSDAR